MLLITQSYRLMIKKYRYYQKLNSYFLEARRLSKLSSESKSIENILKIQANSTIFTSTQNHIEISKLLDIVKRLNARTILEIGTQKGGTLFLFSQVSNPVAQIFSIDFHYPSREYQKSLPKLAKQGQRISCIQADSHADATLQHVKDILGKQDIDFLFIDGDHSYEGVKKDFELYFNLVRPGGIIALHDIVPDYFMKYGQRTNSNVGGVPIFWQELKSQFQDAREFIEDNNQDGFGIGVITRP